MKSKKIAVKARPGPAPDSWAKPVFPPDSFALVIPTLREAANIECLIQRTCAAIDPLHVDYELIIVDDDSRDGIVAVVDQLRLRHPRIRLVTRVGERGLSGAVLHGWACTNATLIGVMDADLQHPPELLPALLTAVQNGKDLAIASRYSHGGQADDWNLLRKLTSRAAVLLTFPVQRHAVRVQDPMSGFFVIRRSCLPQHEFQRAGFKLLLEILIASRIKSVQEIPFSFGSRWSGQSKANVKIAIHFVFLLGKLYLSEYKRILLHGWGREPQPQISKSAEA